MQCATDIGTSTTATEMTTTQTAVDRPSYRIPVSNRNKPLPDPSQSCNDGEQARERQQAKRPLLDDPVKVSSHSAPRVPTLKISQSTDDSRTFVDDGFDEHRSTARQRSKLCRSDSSAESSNSIRIDGSDSETNGSTSLSRKRSTFKEFLNRSNVLRRSSSLLATPRSLSPYGQGSQSSLHSSSSEAIEDEQRLTPASLRSAAHSNESHESNNLSRDSFASLSPTSLHQNASKLWRSRPTPSTDSSSQTQLSSTFSFGRRSSSRTNGSSSSVEDQQFASSSADHSHFQRPKSSTRTHPPIPSLWASRSTSKDVWQIPETSSPVSSQQSETMGKVTSQSTSNPVTSCTPDNSTVSHTRLLEAKTVEEAIAEASRKLKTERPRLHRMKSRSMDNLGATLHPEALNSLAIGTVSIIAVAKPDSTQEEGAIGEKSNDLVSPVHESANEHGSRSVQQLRSRQKSSDIAVTGNKKLFRHMSLVLPALNRNKEGVFGDIQVASAIQLGNGSSGQNDGTNVRNHKDERTGGKDVIPPLPPKDHVQLSSDAWWDETRPNSVLSSRGTSTYFETPLTEFEAVHLATAINSGDVTVEARMAAAAESPKSIIRRLDEEAPNGIIKPRSTGDITALLERPIAVAVAGSASSSELTTSAESKQSRTKTLQTASHKRSVSLQKVFEPFVVKARSRSNTTSGSADDVPSVAAIGDASVPVGNDSDFTTQSAAGRRETTVDHRRLSRRNSPQKSSQPPSSYNALRLSHLLVKSESDPTTLISEQGDQRDAFREASDRSTDAFVICTPVRRSSMSNSAQPAELTEQVTPDDHGLPGEQKRKPDLSLDIETAVRDRDHVRPSSALGMSAHLETKMHRSISREPTLSIVDDMEFLEALEKVRKLKQDRIQRQRLEAAYRLEKQCDQLPPPRDTSLVGDQDVASPVSDHLVGSLATESNNSTIDSPVSAKTATSSSSSITHTPKKSSARRPSALELGIGKASGKLRDGAFLNDEDWKKEVKALFIIRELVLTERSYARHLEALLSAVQAFATAYPLLRRSTTPSLIIATSSAIATRIHQEQQQRPLPKHISLLLNLLPQMITLSRNLASQIDDSPTAAGVGAAFRLVGAQMATSFVTWSASIKDVMEALRASESSSKSKTPLRIGLIDVESSFGTRNHSKQSSLDISGSAAGFASVPVSPVRPHSKLQSARSGDAHDAEGRESTSHRSRDVFVDSPTSVAFEDTAKHGGNPIALPSTKRRSTISYASPSLAFHIRSKLTNTLHQSSGSASDSPSPSPSSSSMPASDKSVKHRKGSMDGRLSKAQSQLAQSSLSPIDTSFAAVAKHSPLNDPVANKGPSFRARPANGSKKMTAMDIAIMPTQRIPRYLLLLRDLLSNTPPQSLSHHRVQQGITLLHRVALDCDRASRALDHRDSLPRNAL